MLELQKNFEQTKLMAFEGWKGEHGCYCKKCFILDKKGTEEEWEKKFGYFRWLWEGFHKLHGLCK